MPKVKTVSRGRTIRMAKAHPYKTAAPRTPSSPPKSGSKNKTRRSRR